VPFIESGRLPILLALPPASAHLHCAAARSGGRYSPEKKLWSAVHDWKNNVLILPVHQPNQRALTTDFTLQQIELAIRQQGLIQRGMVFLPPPACVRNVSGRLLSGRAAALTPL